MTYRLVLTPEAERDLAEARGWYDEQSEGLGAEFLQAIDATMQSIGRDPMRYASVYRAKRRALVRRFPYGVFYVLDGETVVVLAVLHGARHPRRWRERG